MFRGFYTAATGMVAQQRRTELLSSNMSNADTPGFKADRSTIRSFPDMLLSSVSKETVPTDPSMRTTKVKQIGAVNTGIYMQETIPNYEQGQHYPTDSPTDMAITDIELPVNPETGQSGAIFYHLEHPNGGYAYTRNGNFTVDGQGYLVNNQGLYVLSDTGERLQFLDDDFELTLEGNFKVNDQIVSRIGISYAANPDALVKQDNGIFRTLDGGLLPTAYGDDNIVFSLKQKNLEASNVDPMRTMTDLLSAYRTFEANQKILQAYDRSMEKAVTEIGRI